MKGRKRFTQSEAKQIRQLLTKKAKAESSAQKVIRDQLRAIGFYISDFTSSTVGFEAADFDVLVSSGQVSLVD